MMLRPLRSIPGFVVLCAGLCAGFPAAAGAAPPSVPPPPPSARSFPKPTSKPVVGRIIQLEPNQKRITKEQWESAPTVDVANQRRKGGRKFEFKDTAGAPARKRGLLANTQKLTPPTPPPSKAAPKARPKSAAKSKPGTTSSPAKSKPGTTSSPARKKK